jgi:hypothetical protein
MIEVFIQENTVVSHEAIQKYIHIYFTSILSTYAIHTTFDQMSHFLDNKYSSTVCLSIVLALF